MISRLFQTLTLLVVVFFQLTEITHAGIIDQCLSPLQFIQQLIEGRPPAKPRPTPGSLEHFRDLAVSAGETPIVLTSKSGNHYTGHFDQISSDGQFIFLVDETGNTITYRVDKLDLSKTKIQEPIRGPPPPPPVQASVSPNRALLPPPAVPHAQPAARAPPATFSSRVRIEGKSPSDAMRVIHEQGLEPKSAYVVQGVKYSFSELFDMGHGRVGTVAVIDMPDGSQVARVFYRSNSHSEFKALPARVQNSMVFPGYDKGIGQFSLSLPQELQEQLSASLMEGKPVKSLPDASLVAIVQTYTGLERLGVDTPMSGSVSSEKILVQTSGPSIKRGRGNPISRPSDIQLKTPKDRPNFSRVERVYTARTSLSGEVEVRVYQSASGELEYPVYIEKSTGRIWFGNVSNIDSPITDYGVRARAIDSGDLTSPLWDHRQEIGKGYTGPRHPSDSQYASNWNYVREIPEVKRWYQEHGLEVPPPDP